MPLSARTTLPTIGPRLAGHPNSFKTGAVGVEPLDHFGEFFDQRTIEPSGDGQAIEKLIIGEPLHLDQPVDRLAGAAKPQRSASPRA